MSRNYFPKKNTDGRSNPPSSSLGNSKKKIKLAPVIQLPELFSEPHAIVRRTNTMIKSKVDTKNLSLSTEQKAKHPILVTTKTSKTDTRCLESRNKFKTPQSLKCSKSNIKESSRVKDLKVKNCSKATKVEIKESNHSKRESEKISKAITRLMAAYKLKRKKASTCKESKRENEAVTSIKDNKQESEKRSSAKTTLISASNVACKIASTCKESKRENEANFTSIKMKDSKRDLEKKLSAITTLMGATKLELKKAMTWKVSKRENEANFTSIKDSKRESKKRSSKKNTLIPASNVGCKLASTCEEPKRENEANFTSIKMKDSKQESEKRSSVLIPASNVACKIASTCKEPKRENEANFTSIKMKGTKISSGKSTKIDASKAKGKSKSNCFKPIQVKIIYKEDENDISYKDGDCKPDSQNLSNNGSKLVAASKTAHKRVVSFVNLESHKEEGFKSELKKICMRKHQIPDPKFKFKKISAPVESKRKISNVKSSADNDKGWENDENFIANSGVLETLNPTTENLEKYVMPRNEKFIVSRPMTYPMNYPPVSKRRIIFLRVTVMDVKNDPQYINFFNKMSNSC